MPSELSMLQPVIRKLEALSPLAEADRDALAALPFRYEQVESGRPLVREGDLPSQCCLLLSGYAYRHKGTLGGKRQILSFHFAGDFLDLQHVKLPRADHSVDALTDAQVAWVPNAELTRLIRESPSIADALWRDALIDGSIFREWLLSVGRRDGRTRVAHLLCEFAARREAAGVGHAHRFELPMTQEHIADATGLTVVHVNRMLRTLSQEGAISHEGRQLHVSDWSHLQRIAGFHPAYLHMAA